jgi:transcriptional regulator with XRE-family HTH domain
MQSKAFDNYIRSYRKRSGLTQDELSFLLGSKSGTRVSRYELGRREPSLELLLALEAIFGVSVGALYRRRLSKVEESVRERAGKLLMALEGAPRRSHARAILAAIYSNNTKQV